MKAARVLSGYYLESTPDASISPRNILFSDETAFMGKFFGDFEGNPQMSCLTVLSLAGEMWVDTLLVGMISQTKLWK